MANRKKLDDTALAAFLLSAPGWAYAAGGLRKTYRFDAYAAGIAFAVRIGFAAEKHDHHPDLRIGYRQVDVEWTTHDVGGVTELDVAMALHTDLLARAS